MKAYEQLVSAMNTTIKLSLKVAAILNICRNKLKYVTKLSINPLNNFGKSQYLLTKFTKFLLHSFKFCFDV